MKAWRVLAILFPLPALHLALPDPGMVVDLSIVVRAVVFPLRMTFQPWN